MHTSCIAMYAPDSAVLDGNHTAHIHTCIYFCDYFLVTSPVNPCIYGSHDYTGQPCWLQLHSTPASMGHMTIQDSHVGYNSTQPCIYGSHDYTGQPCWLQLHSTPASMGHMTIQDSHIGYISTQPLHLWVT